MNIGTKFLVVKGGTIDVGGPVRLRVGEVWDLVDSESFGMQFRKLNQSGGSTCVLCGTAVARAGLEAGKLRELNPDEPLAVEHDALRKRTGAR